MLYAFWIFVNVQTDYSISPLDLLVTPVLAIVIVLPDLEGPNSFIVFFTKMQKSQMAEKGSALINKTISHDFLLK